MFRRVTGVGHDNGDMRGMRGKVGLIEPDDTLRQQVLSSLAAAGLQAEPFESLREFMLFGGEGGYAVLVADERLDALSVKESLCSEGKWLAVIGYAKRPVLRRVVAFMRGGGYDYFALPIDIVDLSRSLSELGQGRSDYSAARRRAAEARIRLRILSPRESEVLEHMAAGRSNKTIGMDLGISPRTVEIHRANMLSKLGANSSTEALRMYYEDALLNGLDTAPAE